jgi:hypothetical protein
MIMLANTCERVQHRGIQCGLVHGQPPNMGDCPGTMQPNDSAAPHIGVTIVAKPNQTETVNFTIPRAYAHRTHGDIGSVTLVAPGGDYTLNGNVLPGKSVEHLLTFALQTLQDAYAGADNAADAVAAFTAKLDRLISGEIGVRQAGSGVSAMTSAIRQALRPFVKNAIEAQAKGTWKGMDEEARVTAIDTAYEGLSDDDKAKVGEAAQVIIDQRAAEVERQKALGAGLTVKL